MNRMANIPSGAAVAATGAESTMKVMALDFGIAPDTPAAGFAAAAGNSAPAI